MRPIDADRLLKTIANLDVECVDQKQASIMLNTIQKVFPQIVNDEPAIEAEPVNGWISVDDRLPEVFKNVLTIDSEGKIFINWLEDIIEMKGYFAYGGESVTHWQPLPSTEGLNEA